MSENDLQLAETAWPKKFFASEEAWLAYVNKWFPKITK